jgi:hypothetical protein
MWRYYSWCLPLPFVLAVAGGCGHRSDAHLLPSSAVARHALETALTAWQNDQPLGRVASGPPAIEVIDSRWRDGAKIDRFEILDQEPGEGPPRFAVRLTYRAAPSDPVTQQQVVRYVILGQEPLWVYRAEDYDKMSGM